jgi:enolase
MSAIKTITARQVLDSRGNPTVEASVALESGHTASAIVPSGASTGKNEAFELRDQTTSYLGKAVQKAISNIENKIAPALNGLDAFNQRQCDYTMIDLDSTENKKTLGANAILAVSMAVARAASLESGLPLYRYLGGTNSYLLPVPLLNIINGGVHADNGLDFQEFMIAPVGAASFAQAIELSVIVYQTLKSELKKSGHLTAVGDEGGFAPNINDATEALDLILNSIEKAGFSCPKDFVLAIDAAASELFHENKYTSIKRHNQNVSSEEMVNYWVKLTQNYPIASIEDPLSENDREGWKQITNALGKRVQLVGDDIFVTNPDLISEGIAQNIANSVLIKLNQIGTVSETLEAIELTTKASYSCIISHRSGETEDTFIADLSVAVNSPMIKTGAPARSERVAKYNRLLKIEQELESSARYAGIKAFKGFLNET